MLSLLSIILLGTLHKRLYKQLCCKTCTSQYSNLGNVLKIKYL
jgi:hypothetical protein